MSCLQNIYCCAMIKVMIVHKTAMQIYQRLKTLVLLQTKKLMVLFYTQCVKYKLLHGILCILSNPDNSFHANC